MHFLIVLAALLSTPSARADRWNSANDPGIMDPSFVYELSKLPTAGELSRRPWSETYWPSAQGSINIRWNLPQPYGFGYASPTREQVAKMSQDELKTLSPSEKYDIFMGRYDYPLKHEVEGIATPRARWWSGICDGWSIAATQYAEPQPVTLANPDGIMVPFGSSDVKGLISYHAARHFEVQTRQVGARCHTAGRVFGSPNCSDINPGALHVILANQIGLKKQGFVVERDPGNQIWNQPAYGFKFEIVGSSAHGVQVHGFLFYADELEKSEWEPVVGTPKFVEGKLELDYTLDLDGSGRIIGGSWLRDSDRPDFVWLPVNHMVFASEMDGLNRIYKPVAAQASGSIGASR
ncbi:MAG: hypothetical protein JST80_04755 [Bdellovibrionales bacterium]|nr:hypothetical protein [Bdellovibrionales bacterium]